jgi:hypothetical protein
MLERLLDTGTIYSAQNLRAFEFIVPVSFDQLANGMS